MPDTTTILLADTNDTSRPVITDALTALGYDVLHADTGAAVLDMARESQPQLVILDAEITEPDGFATCTQLRTDATTGKIPIIMLGAGQSLENEIQILRAGADEMLTRPIDERALVLHVQTALPSAGAAAARVLVVDDSDVNLQVMEGYLHATGYEIDLASSGADAVKLAQQNLPDVILLDVQMPGMTGYDVCEILKQDPRTQGIPVMFVTANALSNEEMLRGYECGAVDYLRKPFLRDELLARLQVMVRIKQQQTDLERQVHTDALTNLANRRHLLKRLTEEFSRARRHKTDLTVLMMDIDRFKRVNDTHGHEAGDVVLRAAAASVADMIRAEDLVARYGGEEFALLLPDTPLDAALILADRVRRTIAELHIEYGETTLPVTVSIGVANFPMLSIQRPQELLRYADNALYAAKEAGRNRVRAYHPSPAAS